MLEGLYDVSRETRQQAPDGASRDLGIIANGQLALHYWITAFGTIRAYAEQLGLSGIGQAMQTSLDEAKAANERHNEIAATIMGA
ncbi:Protein YciF [Methylobacterium isbiliense]|uniref:Uncharacterized protein n=2 Tax=Methylobacteriaceae TaxID=119045 RepID=C5B087_METEA|nr:conserved hypothetical protein [Methylorubrum extorquens AM1]MCP1542454.1 ferritin-like metal-binding protein YciE [Methylorubrum extorquens]MCP1590201.1 ferritin-like metal-binding protein YciE [Methylorubrum extorquens]GJD98912.1 Protein YciF [Methylobacterium isbiliense]